jgi:hypothetical protein
MSTTSFPGFGISPNLIPDPPPSMPEAPGASDATAGLSPFSKPQDVDSIIKQLNLDRPLKLYIPNMHNYPGWEFRVINSVAHEIADAHNKGFEPVTNEELVKLFDNLVAGVDKEGKAFRPLLVSRPTKVGDHVRRQNRLKLQSLYAGMDPANKEFSGKYTHKVDKKDGTFGQFSGWGFRIRA